MSGRHRMAPQMNDPGFRHRLRNQPEIEKIGRGLVDEPGLAGPVSANCLPVRRAKSREIHACRLSDQGQLVARRIVQARDRKREIGEFPKACNGAVGRDDPVHQCRATARQANDENRPCPAMLHLHTSKRLRGKCQFQCCHRFDVYLDAIGHLPSPCCRTTKQEFGGARMLAQVFKLL